MEQELKRNTTSSSFSVPDYNQDEDQAIAPALDTDALLRRCIMMNGGEKKFTPSNEPAFTTSNSKGYNPNPDTLNNNDMANQILASQNYLLSPPKRATVDPGTVSLGPLKLNPLEVVGLAAVSAVAVGFFVWWQLGSREEKKSSKQRVNIPKSKSPLVEITAIEEEEEEEETEQTNPNAKNT